MPIIIFKNYQQAYDCLFYWRELLGLQNWIINIILDYSAPIEAPNWGSSLNHRAIHVATITIPMPWPGQINPFPIRYCQEEIVIHELLHILWPRYEVNHNTTEGNFYLMEVHASLEQTAKALLMARYGLDISWFYNF